MLLNLGHHGIQLNELLLIAVDGVLNAGRDRGYLDVQAIEIGVDALVEFSMMPPALM